MSGKKSLSEAVTAFAAKPDRKAITTQNENGYFFRFFCFTT